MGNIKKLTTPFERAKNYAPATVVKKFFSHKQPRHSFSRFKNHQIKISNCEWYHQVQLVLAHTMVYKKS